MIGIDISALYKNIGINTAALVRYKIPEGNQNKGFLVYNVPEIQIEENNVRSVLGLPVMFPILFKGGRYEIYENGEVKEIDLEDFWLPETTVCTFRAQKQATQTVINGGNSRIIEVWSDLLWDIEFRGIILSNEIKTAEEITKKLVDFARIKEVSVVGDIFNWLKIDKIFVENIEIQQQQGWGDILTYSMSAVQTQATELIL